MVTSVCSSKECTHNTLFAIGKTPMESSAQTLLAAVESVYTVIHVYTSNIMCVCVWDHSTKSENAKLRTKTLTIMVVYALFIAQHATRSITKLQCCRVQQQQWPPVGSTTPWRKSCSSFRNPPTGVPTLAVPVGPFCTRNTERDSKACSKKRKTGFPKSFC